MRPARHIQVISKSVQRVRAVVRGAVQGVGFRPFIYRLALEEKLAGWVKNTSQGVVIEVEGGELALQSFLLRIERETPPRAFIQSFEFSFLDAVGYAGFAIQPSDETGRKTALVLPDVATCADCLREVLDPQNRRYLYPFTNCTNCGPRFSIIEALPYDRRHTTMKTFVMCEACRAEYENPLDRRFHAQPNACPACGPHLELWDAAGAMISARHDALRAAAAAIRRGEIVALKGLGGFQLFADARNDEAVKKLRERKRREAKPFALMCATLDATEELCDVSELEARLLASPEAPIVLLRRRTSAQVSPLVAPNNPYLGVMLPCTPLHHLLLRELQIPIIATSGNLSDEPICTDEREAVERLRGIADLFLVHNRPLARHVDDSIVRVVMGREMVLRRARGYAPLPIHTAAAARETLAVGAHQKNAVAASLGGEVFISQHIGDLETEQSNLAFRRVIASFERLYEFSPQAVAHDAHPDYVSTKFALSSRLPHIAVQHHYAHALACLAENEVAGPALAVTWDGTGYGTDGTIWGGEFLRVTPDSFVRAAYLRTFRLPGGERAVREPRRSALGLLYELYCEEVCGMDELLPVQAFSAQELNVLGVAIKRGLNAPLTSSMGRLFDAVASITGLRHVVRFEGQAAMELEFALDGVTTDEHYTLQLIADSGPMMLDWSPMIDELRRDVRAGTPLGVMSARFHNALVEAMLAVARAVGEEKVALTGGCFQNKYLTERAVQRLRAAGFRPYWHQRIPPNDGGIALGQACAAARAMRQAEVNNG